MISLFMTAILQTAVLATGVEATPISNETYTEARQIVTETGKPLVVMVSTDWCPPCQTMKKTVLPRVREGGLLRKVVFAMVNPDHDHELAEKLIGGGPIPQLVMFRKKGDGWVRKTLVGGQSVETVEQFIKDGVAEDKKENTSSEANDASGPSVSPTESTEVHRESATPRHG
jgi:thioredoxin-like negative regulator of GroEL